MDDDELIRRMKNAYQAGKSSEEVTRALLKQGYRLEYINLLNKKAKGVNKLIVVLVSLVLIFFMGFVASTGFVAYVVLNPKSIDEKVVLENPLEGKKINFEKKVNFVDDESGDVVSEGSLNEVVFEEGSGDSLNEKEEVYVDDVEITPEFISYLLNELGVWQLKSNPITGSKPVLNFVIGEDKFYSVVDDSVISTFEGLSEESDVTLTSTKDDIVLAMTSENPKDVFKKSFDEGRSGIVMDKSEAVLFSKGYLTLYKELTN